jgi:hypothetical protein
MFKCNWPCLPAISMLIPRVVACLVLCLGGGRIGEREKALCAGTQPFHCSDYLYRLHGFGNSMRGTCNSRCWLSSLPVCCSGVRVCCVVFVIAIVDYVFDYRVYTEEVQIRGVPTRRMRLARAQSKALSTTNRPTWTTWSRYLPMIDCLFFVSRKSTHMFVISSCFGGGGGARACVCAWVRGWMATGIVG